MVTISKNVQFAVDDKKLCRRWLRAVKKRKDVLEPVYCITCANPRIGVAEVEPLYTVAMEAQKRDILVVGLAGTRDSAFELLQQMLLRTYNETDDFDLSAVYGE